MRRPTFLLSAVSLWLAAGVSSGCPAEAYRLDSREAQVADALARQADADSLAAAGLLSAAHPETESQLLTRAMTAVPARADLVWLQIQACQKQPACDSQALERHLQTLDPDNGAPWLGALARADAAHDEPAKHAALAAISRSTRVDIYWTTLIARLSHAAARTGKMPLPDTMVLIIGLLSAQAVPALHVVSESCKGERLERAADVDVCRGIARAFEGGDTYLAEMFGAAIAQRVWPEQSPQWVAATDARRSYEYRTTLQQKIDRRPLDDKGRPAIWRCASRIAASRTCHEPNSWPPARIPTRREIEAGRSLPRAGRSVQSPKKEPWGFPMRRLHRSGCGGALLGSLAILASAAAPAAPAPGTRYAQIDDQALQMPAGLLQVPTGWKAVGIVARPQGCHAQGPFMKYTAQAPDGVTAVELLPGWGWWWQSNFNPYQPRPPGFCMPVTADSAESFLRDVVLPQLRPNAQLIAVEDPPPQQVEALRNQLERMQEQNAAQARSLGLAPHHLVHEGKRVRIRYQRNGQSVEELISAVVDCSTARMPGNMVAPPYFQRFCGSNGTVIQRAPAGQFDPQLLGSVRLTPNPAWLQQIAARQQAQTNAMIGASWQAFHSMQAASDAAAAARTAEWAAAEQQRAQSVQESLNEARASQAAQDHAAHEFENAILGKSTYSNPQTGQRIVTGNQYSHLYQSADGSTLYKTNGPEDPNRDPAFTQVFTELDLQH
ncbi:MAG TPA: hypothetical protein VNX02_18495 [Steroidobacteraceae bacterium]|nr:hypothetical protein [Steroidobacteraceae bacterium]